MASFRTAAALIFRPPDIQSKRDLHFSLRLLRDTAIRLTPLRQRFRTTPSQAEILYEEILIFFLHHLFSS
jgi:hypothetical protein